MKFADSTITMMEAINIMDTPITIGTVRGKRAQLSECMHGSA